MAASIGLVTYSDSDSSSDSDDDTSLINAIVQEANGRPANKRKLAPGNELDVRQASASKKVCDRLPTVPLAITSLFSGGKSRDDHIDDPSLHSGRVRSFKHEIGNWATFLYIPVPDREAMRALQEQLQGVLRLHGTFEPVDDLHISLSRTFPIRHHWIDPLLESVRKKVNSMNQFTCCLSGLNPLQVYTNDEKTRTFVAIQVSGCESHMVSLVETIDEALSEFRLPKYYQNPSFHVSVLWGLGDLTVVIDDEVRRKMQECVWAFCNDNPNVSVFPVERLLCKTGNKVHSITLSPR